MLVHWVLELGVVRANISSPSYDNSYTARADIGGGGNPAELITADQAEVSGAQESTASWTTSGTAMGCMVTFEPAAAGPTTRRYGMGMLRVS